MVLVRVLWVKWVKGAPKFRKFRLFLFLFLHVIQLKTIFIIINICPHVEISVSMAALLNFHAYSKHQNISLPVSINKTLTPLSFLLKSLRNVACCLRTLNNSNNIQSKIDINSNAKLKKSKKYFCMKRWFIIILGSWTWWNWS